jgi:predicted nucleic acid-binding protein
LDFLAALVRAAEVVDVKEVVTECRDPDDNRFLELAVSGKATHILTGDADLLALHPFRGVPILTPQDFLTAAQGGAT